MELDNWTIKAFKDAVYRYLKEHGKIDKSGHLEIHFWIRSKKKFWGKIAARRKGYEVKKGIYQNIDLTQVEKK